MYIIDDASTDSSVEVAKRTANQDPRIHIIENEYNMSAVYNKTINFVNHAEPQDEDVIITLDGDDYLLHNKVLSYLRGVYKEDVWLTYGGAIIPEGQQVAAHWFQAADWRVSLRNQGFCLTHLRSHKFFLLKNVKNKDLRYQTGGLFRYPEDIILFIPMAEMAGEEHCRHLKQKSYFYNIHDNCDFAEPEKDRHIGAIIAHDLSFRKPYKIKTREQLINCECDWG